MRTGASLPDCDGAVQAHLGVVVTRARDAVAAFLARGRAARLAACAVVSAAAFVWLSALVVLLRVLSVIAFVAAVAWLIWLVGRVWRERPHDWEAKEGSFTKVLRARARTLAARAVPDRSEPEGLDAAEDPDARAARWEAGIADVRRAVAALNADLAEWQVRLVGEVERCQRELAAQIDALPELVGRAAPPEPEPRVPEAAAPAEPDIDAVLNEIETDLRLEKVEERERLLAEREERLERRERDLAAFVHETQARIA